jgi:hypothetical protein
MTTEIDDEHAAMRERMKLWGIDHLRLTLPLRCAGCGAILEAVPWATACSEDGATLMICLPCQKALQQRAVKGGNHG